MEDLVKLFKLANELNEKQNKVYAVITYQANDNKALEIIIRSKNGYECLEKHNIQLSICSMIDITTIVNIFEKYVGGIASE